MPLNRNDILPEDELPSSQVLLDEGRKLASNWTVGTCAFLDHYDVANESTHKRHCISNGRIMQHAQVGFRDVVKSHDAYRNVFERCSDQGVTIDRYGICLDWSMGYPRDGRADRPMGTGLILNEPEEFAALTALAPVAPHFGDFVLGFPASLETTQCALAAGSTSIGNLGQYFTFRLPDWDDDVETTRATLKALGLIVSQPTEILIHSNIDDGFAALFTDLSSSLGAVLLEKYIVDDLIGGKISHCFGHHYTAPVKRLAFQLAVSSITQTPGTMIYGNTVSYRGDDAQNYASLASYLLADIAGQRRNPTGHAINAVPVLENKRIPDIDEIVDAQLFAARLVDQAGGYDALIDFTAAEKLSEEIVTGGRQFLHNVLDGFDDAGINTKDPFEMLLAVRRLGSKRMESLFGAGQPDDTTLRGRRPIVSSDIGEEIVELASEKIAGIDESDRAVIRQGNLKAMVATTDVHEHGKLLVDEVLRGLGIEVIDGGVSADPDDIALAVQMTKPDFVAISTYNGVAMRFFSELQTVLQQRDLNIPILMGGRLNQIPENSNTSLPVDMTSRLHDAGAVVCLSIEDAIPHLTNLSEQKRDTPHGQ